MGGKRKPDWLRRYEQRQKQANPEPPKRRSRSVPREARAKSDGCEVCGSKAVSLKTHHIVPLRKSGEDSIRNAIRLCHPCEDIAHGRVEGPGTTPYRLLRYAAQYGVIGGHPRNTILAAVEGQRQAELAALTEAAEKELDETR